MLKSPSVADLQDSDAMSVDYPPPPPALSWECWAVHDYEKVVAVFPTEIEALRHAVAESYLKVKRVQPGELWEQIR